MLASGILLLLLSGAAPAGDGESVDESIRRFKSDYNRYGVRDEDRIRAVGILAAHRSEKVSQVLLPLLTHAPVPVRIVVARHLAGFSGVPGVPEGLMKALTRNSGASGRGVRVTILRSLGALRAPVAAPAVDGYIGSQDVWEAKAAMEAAGNIRAASSVDALIKALVRLDGPSGDREITLDISEGDLPATSSMMIIKREADEKDQRRKTQRHVLREPLLASLTSITRASFSGVKEWQAWWRTRKRDYVVPK